jgi:hypothetical protein
MTRKSPMGRPGTGEYEACRDVRRDGRGMHPRPGRCAVRKKLGLTLVSEKVGDERVYRIVSPDAQSVKTKSPRRAA